jgi:hypothetical protein
VSSGLPLFAPVKIRKCSKWSRHISKSFEESVRYLTFRQKALLTREFRGYD